MSLILVNLSVSVLLWQLAATATSHTYDMRPRDIIVLSSIVTILIAILIWKVLSIGINGRAIIEFDYSFLWRVKTCPSDHSNDKNLGLTLPTTLGGVYRVTTQNNICNMNRFVPKESTDYYSWSIEAVHLLKDKLGNRTAMYWMGLLPDT